MSDLTTNLHLPYLAAGQAQKHVIVNESLRWLDAIVQLTIVSASTSAQPATPNDGDVYILPAGKSGATWGVMANAALAYYRDGAWEETPREGWRGYVRDSDQLVAYSGATWTRVAPAYAAGDFTPTISFATPSDLSAAYASQVGHYMRIGDLVYFEMVVSRALTYTTAAGDLVIGGLPFAAAFTTGATLASVGPGIVSSSGYNQIEGRVLAGGVTATITQLGDNKSAKNFEVANIASGTSLAVRMGGVYRTAA